VGSSSRSTYRQLSPRPCLRRHLPQRHLRSTPHWHPPSPCHITNLRLKTMTTTLPFLSLSPPCLWFPARVLRQHSHPLGFPVRPHFGALKGLRRMPSLPLLASLCPRWRHYHISRSRVSAAVRAPHSSRSQSQRQVLLYQLLFPSPQRKHGRVLVCEYPGPAYPAELNGIVPLEPLHRPIRSHRLARWR
jgi:hypothetical protein